MRARCALRPGVLLVEVDRASMSIQTLHRVSVVVFFVVVLALPYAFRAGQAFGGWWVGVFE